MQTPPAGFRESLSSIQPCRTILVDISQAEDEILERMKQKTRYNIRLAAKRGVVVRTSADLHTFHRLMNITSQRDQFGVHSYEYYQRAYEFFYDRGECELLQAEYDNQVIAAIMVFARWARAWYFYGASSDLYREFMPTYLLQWKAMLWAKSQGCKVYDLWGIPDYEEPYLEDNFISRSDGLWGVYRYKRGFGGTCARTVGPWDRVYYPILYKLYKRRKLINQRAA